MKENKMGVMPIRQLIINMSLPMMVSMLVQALYNIVDSIFVARISENALTAVTLAFPLQNMMIAVATGTGVGMNAILSRALGAKNKDEADDAANTGIFLAFCSFLLFLVIGLFFTNAFIRSQTNVDEIITYGDAYLGIVCSLSFGSFFQICFERLLQSTGRTVLSMTTQMIGAVCNIILDPILIFGLFGMPRLGVAGAAYATVAGQIIAAVMGLILNLKYNSEISLSWKKILHPKGTVVRRIYAVGVPSILMVSIGSVMTYLMNLILIAFSTTATAVFGVYFKLQSFFFMPVFGLNNGMIPILAYNYGAKQKKRIEDALRFALVLAFSVMVAGTVIFELFPTQLLALFSASEDMTAMGIVALRIIALHFPIAAIGIVLSSVFQAFARSIYSLIVSLSRQLIVLIPVAWLLAQTGSVNNVWWSFIIAECVSVVMSFLFFRKIYREVIKPL